MENVSSLAFKFIDSLNEHLRKNIIALIVYGSRVSGNAKPDSDLDVLLICNGNNSYRIGKVIDGIKIDCSMYGANKVYDVMYEKKLQNNSYFNSVLNSGRVLIDKNGTVDELKYYLEEIEIEKLSKRQISMDMIFELSDLYNAYREDMSDINYYNLLEKIRIIYHYKTRNSFLSLIKVPTIYQNSEFYKKHYQITLPSADFMKLFLEALSYKDDVRRSDVLGRLLKFLNISFSNKDECFSTKDDYLSDAEISYKLLIIYNRINYLQRLVKEDNNSFDYIFYVTYSQLQELKKSLKSNVDEVEVTDMMSKMEKMRILLKSFTGISSIYHFDCNEYMLKLK